MEAVISAAAAPAVKQPSVVLTKAPASKILATLMSVAGIIERRHTLPILANVLVSKRGGTLEFTGTDLDLQMRASAEVGHGDSEVTTTVNARKLVDILKAMPGEQSITLTLNGEKLTLTGGKSRFTVQTMPASDFPLVVQSKDTTAHIEIEQKVLAGLIAQVQYAMGVSDTRYYLNGLLLETDGNTVRVVATDGNRLAMSQADLGAPVAKSSVIIPRKAVLELARLLNDDSGPADIAVTSNQATFRFNGIEFTTKLVEGKFPDYRRVIPANHKNKVTFERAMLLKALQRAQLMSSEKFKGVELNFSSETLELRAVNGDQEEAQEELGIDYAGDALRMGFNVRYLIDALENLVHDTVAFAMADSSASVLITDPSEPELRVVVMPMRL